MYIGSTDTAIISAMTTHNPLPTTIGCSWGWTPADPSTLDPYFEKMAAQGQNFFAASGDSSTWSSQKRSLAGRRRVRHFSRRHGPDNHKCGGPWESETAWVDSGGGISPDKIAIPSWQQLPGVINSSNKGSTTLRNGPDVSANANFTFYVCADQTTCTANEYGGTSFAAPMWAGYIALVNQQLVANGKSTIGFINPTIYAQNVTLQLRHRLPRHHQRHVRQLFRRHRLRPGHRMGQSQLPASSLRSPGRPHTHPSFTISANPASLSVAAAATDPPPSRLPSPADSTPPSLSAPPARQPE